MPRNGGRKTKLTPEMQTRICDALRAGNFRDTAAITSGICEKTLYTWINKGEESPNSIYGKFLQELKVAEQEAEARALAQIQKAANGFEVKKKKITEYANGDMQITEEKTMEFDWKAAAWYLQRTKGMRYREIQSHEHSGPDGGAIKIVVEYEDDASD